MPLDGGSGRPDASADRRRDSDRLRILGDVRGEVMAFQPMMLREISRDGAEIDTTFPLQIDSLHDIRLTLGDWSVVLKGRVAHCSISDVDQESVRYRSGIEFVEVSDRVSAVIADFIAAIWDGRRAR